MIQSKDQLDYIDSQWSNLNQIGEDVCNKMPIISNDIVHLPGKIYILNFSDIKHSWSVKHLLQLNGKSESLIALGGKIKHMIFTGKADSVKPMILSIASGKEKVLRQPGEKGWGHFRWNHSFYTLTDKEIKRLKEYFNI